MPSCASWLCIAARTAASAVEACYTDSQDYSQCTSAAALGGLGVKVGSGPGQVQVTAADPASYEVSSKTAGGPTFTIAKTAGGALKRTCTPDGPGCASSTW